MMIRVSFPEFYQFDGWIFEWSRTKPFGPWPCKKDLEPRKRAGRKFYEVFGRFHALTIEEQDSFRVYRGAA